jgi:tetratricopeptide (TPR) repeat protein
MSDCVRALLVACIVLPLAGPARADAPAPLFNDLGSFSRPISTSNAAAQRYFSQGLILAYGFNHREAARSFRAAARLEPGCAICWWGVALVLGPNINMPMVEEDFAEAYQASRRALALRDTASPVERTLIEALSLRYAEEPPADRSSLDKAYAEAMRSAARLHPDDVDVLALAAESLLDLSPWDYWTGDGQPKNAVQETVALLERAIARQADHPGALHLYIHAVEASARPEQAMAAADRLNGLVPGAGHLVHMPAHIYIRTGRYHDAVEVNIRAGEADQSYIAQCNAQGVYPLLYHPHNWHFVWAAATLEGNQRLAGEGAQKTAALMAGHDLGDPAFAPIVQHFTLTPLYHAVRFGRWQEALDYPAPAADFPYVQAMRHYARGMALAAKGRSAAALQELRALQRIATDPRLAQVQISPRNNAQNLVAVAERVLAGVIEARRGRYRRALPALEQAVALEDALGYNEPADWPHPVRQVLGAVLLDAKRAADAERVYREDLAKLPQNGWSLFGLERSLRLQGKSREAAEVKEKFALAWRHADVTLSASMIR